MNAPLVTQLNMEDTIIMILLLLVVIQTVSITILIRMVNKLMVLLEQKPPSQTTIKTL